jgi:hypothetical protein
MNRQEPKSPAYIVLVRRLAGYLVDILLLFAAIVITQFGLEALTGGLPLRLLTTGPRIQGWVWLSVSLPTYLYFALSESSAYQATPGKRLLGLHVIDNAHRGKIFPQFHLRQSTGSTHMGTLHFSCGQVVVRPAPCTWERRGVLTLGTHGKTEDNVMEAPTRLSPPLSE